MKTVTCSEFRQNIASHLDASGIEGEELIVTRRARKSVVLMKQSD